MKINFERPEESYTARKHRECSERALKNDQIREFGAEEEEIVKSPSRFLNPVLWLVNFILARFEMFKNNLYETMDESVVIYDISAFDLKRLNANGVDAHQYNGQIVLMSLPVMQKKYIATIKWKGSKADKTKQAMDMFTMMATTTYVTVPPATVTSARTLATNYGNSGSGNEESTFTLLNNAMQAIMFLYQTYGNSNPGTAEVGIKSGGFTVKTITPRGKQPWNAFNSVVQGTIDLTAKGTEKQGGFHDWHISFDGVSFDRMLPTTKASTQVTGLAGGIEVWFMHQIITKDGPQGFDLIIQITVNR